MLPRRGASGTGSGSRRRRPRVDSTRRRRRSLTCDRSRFMRRARVRLAAPPLPGGSSGGRLALARFTVARLLQEPPQLPPRRITGHQLLRPHPGRLGSRRRREFKRCSKGPLSIEQRKPCKPAHAAIPIAGRERHHSRRWSVARDGQGQEEELGGPKQTMHGSLLLGCA